MLLVRANLPHKGWTKEEAAKLQVHIDKVWLPDVLQMLVKVGGTEFAEKTLRVIKTHMVIAHSTDRLLSHGGVRVHTGDSKLRMRMISATKLK